MGPFDAAGEQTTLVQPEGTVTTGYDLNGFVDTVTDWRGDTITMVNDADGRMIDVARSNGVDSVYGYDTAGRLNNIAHTNGATLIDSFTYTCLLYTSPSPRDRTRSRMPSSA